MVQFLLLIFFSWISSIFVGFFKSSRFLCHSVLFCRQITLCPLLFFALTYADGSRPPARPECLLHSLKYIIAVYILKISLNETRCVHSKVISTSPLACTSTGHISRYSRTPHIRTLVIRIAIHPNRLGLSCHHFLTVIVLHHFRF